MATETRSDGELLRRAASGDGEAFTALYAGYETILAGFLVRRTRDPHLAADLAARVGVPEATVRQRVSRGLARSRTTLEGRPT